MSCERHNVDTSSGELLSVQRRSAFVARAEGTACFEVWAGNTSSGIIYAIYGDGTHEIRESRGNGHFTLYDYNNNEEWTIQLKAEDQVFITVDRSIHNVGVFAKITDLGMEFADTDNPILKSVANILSERNN